MHFYKLSALGQDYIFTDDNEEFGKLSREDIKLICDRTLGAGATGIFCIHQKEAENTEIRAFYKNGEIMREMSTASICAVLGLKMIKGKEIGEILSEKCRFFTCLSVCDDRSGLVSCDSGRGGVSLFKDMCERKTHLGNRILTLTPVCTSGSYAVHFSGDAKSINLKYLAEKTNELTLFGKNTSLIVAEETGRNTFSLCRMLENEEYIVPFAGGFSAAAFAACKTGRSRFGDELVLFCEDYKAYAVAKEDGSVTIHTQVNLAYEGCLC